MIKYFFIILLSISLFSPLISSALELTYPDIPGAPALNDSTDINELVAWLYYFIVMVAGLAAFVMLIWGGFQYITSAGNPSAIGDAKDRIFNAVFGLILIFASYIILQAINPELLMLNLPNL